MDWKWKIVAMALVAAVLLPGGFARAEEMLPVAPKAFTSAAGNQSTLSAFALGTGQGEKAKTSAEVLYALPNTDMFLYVLDAKTAASAGLAFLDASYGEKVTYIIQEFAIYRDEQGASGTSSILQRVGVGIRLIIQVDERTAKVSTLGLPKIALGVELNNLKATVRMQVIGIQGPGVSNAFELPSELNFTTLSGLYRAVDVVKGLVWGKDTRITPQVLAESKPKGKP